MCAVGGRRVTPPPYPRHTLQHDLHGHGQLHHKGPLQFWDSAPSRRPLEVQVFLFDLRLIITEPQDESGFYQYKTDCILVRGGGARGEPREGPGGRSQGRGREEPREGPGGEEPRKGPGEGAKGGARGGAKGGARGGREWAVWWWEGQTLWSGAVWEQFVPLPHGPTCCCCRPTLCR